MTLDNVIDQFEKAKDVYVTDIYEVESWHDDRGGMRRTECFAADSNTANYLSKGNSFYGADGSVKPRKSIIIENHDGTRNFIQIGTTGVLVENLDHHEELKKQQIRDQAIKKLTKEEREALGL